jgi:hypothetical protein
MLRINSISGQNDKGDPFIFGQSLRLAYLLGDKVLVSGSGHMAVNYDEYLKNPGEQLKKSMVLQYAKKIADPNYYVQVERMYQTLKDGKQIKHPPKAVIVARARCTKALDQLFESSVTEMKRSFSLCGYTGLYKLKEEGAIETIGGDDDFGDDSKPQSTAESLAAKWNGNDEVYTIIPPFQEFITANNLSISENALNPDADVFTFPLLSFPTINHFTVGELKALKLEVFGNSDTLREAIAAWSLELKATNFAAARVADYRAYYKTFILPHLDEVKQKIAQSELVQRFKELQADLATEYELMLMPAKTYWEYLAWSNMVPKSGLYIFEQDLAESANADKAVLCLSCQAINTSVVDEEVKNEIKKGLRL